VSDLPFIILIALLIYVAVMLVIANLGLLIYIVASTL